LVVPAIYVVLRSPPAEPGAAARAQS
jgi:hypothetical protein